MVFDLSTLVPAMAFIPYLIFTFFGLTGRKDRKIQTPFIVYMLLMAVWSFGSFMMHARTPLMTPLFWNRFMLVGLTGVAFVIYHTLLVLSGNFRKSYRTVLYIGYVAYVGVLVMNFTGHIVTDAYFIGDVFHYDLAREAMLVFIVSYSYLLIGIFTLLRTSYKRSGKILNVRLIWPIFGALVMLVGVLMNLYEPIGRYPVDLLAATVNAFLLFYAVYKYRLVHYSMTVLRIVLYFILISLSVIVFYAVLWLFMPGGVENQSIRIIFTL